MQGRISGHQEVASQTCEGSHGITSGAALQMVPAGSEDAALAGSSDHGVCAERAVMPLGLFTYQHLVSSLGCRVQSLDSGALGFFV